MLFATPFAIAQGSGSSLAGAFADGVGDEFFDGDGVLVLSPESAAASRQRYDRVVEFALPMTSFVALPMVLALSMSLTVGLRNTHVGRHVMASFAIHAVALLGALAVLVVFALAHGWVLSPLGVPSWIATTLGLTALVSLIGSQANAVVNGYMPTVRWRTARVVAALALYVILSIVMIGAILGVVAWLSV